MAIVGIGTTFERGTASLGEVISVNVDGVTREAIDVTHLGVSTTSATNTYGNAIFIPSGVCDPGEVSIELFLTPSTFVETCLWESAQTYTMAGPGGTRTFSAFCTGVSQAVVLDDAIRQTMTFKVTGATTASTATT